MPVRARSVLSALGLVDRVILDTPMSPGNCFCFFKDKHGNFPTPPEAVTQITRITFDLSKPDAEAVNATTTRWSSPSRSATNCRAGRAS